MFHNCSEVLPLGFSWSKTVRARFTTKMASGVCALQIVMTLQPEPACIQLDLVRGQLITQSGSRLWLVLPSTAHRGNFTNITKLRIQLILIPHGSTPPEIHRCSNTSTARASLWCCFIEKKWREKVPGGVWGEISMDYYCLIRCTLRSHTKE